MLQRDFEFNNTGSGQDRKIKNRTVEQKGPNKTKNGKVDVISSIHNKNI